MKKTSLLLALFLASCSENEINYADQKPEEIYNTAMTALKTKDSKKAARVFSEIEKNHPYSDYAIKGQIMSAYAYYLANEYDESSEAYNVFVQLHPSHVDVPYAIYMRGVCAYEQIPIVQRDQDQAEESLKIFEDLIKRYPESKYSKDALDKIDLIKDHLSGREMNVGRFYMSVYSYISAINRFKSVIDLYPKTNHVPEARFRMVEAYTALGIKDQAKAYFESLKKHHPESSWFKKAQELISK